MNVEDTSNDDSTPTISWILNTARDQAGLPPSRQVLISRPQTPILFCMAIFGFSKSRAPGEKTDEPASETPPVTPSTPGEDDRYRAVDFDSFPMADGHEVIHAKTVPHAQECPSFIVGALSQCASFRTIDHHLAHIATRSHIDPRDLGPVREHLETLAEQGFMVSLAGLRTLLAGTPAEPSESLPPITTVGIVTASRADMLQQCLVTHMDSAASHDRRLDFVVVDDSRQGAVRTNCRSLLKSIASDRNASISYAGLEEKENYLLRLADELSGDGISEELLRFALLGSREAPCTPGANRNCLLLHCAGDLFLSSDDDVDCKPATVPGQHDGLILGSVEPTELWFFDNRGDAFAAAEYTNEDLLALHEGMLGQPLASIARARSEASIEADQLSPAALRCFMLGGGRVRVTASGFLGDSGMSSPGYFLFIAGPTRERLWLNEDAYRNACTTRAVLRAATGWTVSTNARLMMAAAGIDARDLLPPFVPVMRNEDGIFGAVLRNCFDDSCIGHVPRAVRHDPPGERSFGADDIWSRIARLRTSDYMLRLVAASDHGPGAGDAAARLGSLGRHLRALGDLQKNEVEELLRVERWRHLSECTHHLETALNVLEPPAHIADDMQRCLEHLATTSLSDECVPPVDAEGCADIPDAIDFFRGLLGRFGELLQAWPTVVEGARRLREHGERPALRLT